MCIPRINVFNSLSDAFGGVFRENNFRLKHSLGAVSEENLVFSDYSHMEVQVIHISQLKSARDSAALLSFWGERCGDDEKRHFVSFTAIVNGMNSQIGRIYVAWEDPQDPDARRIVGSLVVQGLIGRGALVTLFVAPNAETAKRLLKLAGIQAAKWGYPRLIAMLPQPERCPWLTELGFSAPDGTWFYHRELAAEERKFGERRVPRSIAKREATVS